MSLFFHLFFLLAQSQRVSSSIRLRVLAVLENVVRISFS